MKTKTSGVEISLKPLKQLPGVLDAWQYRGQIHLKVMNTQTDQLSYAFTCKLETVEVFNQTSILKTTWRHPIAQGLQDDAQLNLESRSLEEALQATLEQQLQWNPHGELDELDSELRMTQEDELDQPGNKLLSPPGYIGHIYPDEHDLNRGMKQDI